MTLEYLQSLLSADVGREVDVPHRPHPPEARDRRARRTMDRIALQILEDGWEQDGRAMRREGAPRGATGGQAKAAGYPRINGSTKARRARIHPSQSILPLPSAIEIES
jgi:hypothetical protein